MGYPREELREWGHKMPYNLIVARLRGVCILAVIVLHYSLFFPASFLGTWAENGYCGVTAFFVVSGFLITANMIARYGDPANVKFREFYRMRAARILPMLVLTLLVLSALAATRLQAFRFVDQATYERTLINVLTLRYNLHVEGPFAWVVLWSLCIEEAFYLGYPMVVAVSRFRRALVIALIAVVLFGPIYRALQPGWSEALCSYPGCFDAISLGALAALAADRLSARMSPPASLSLLTFGATLMAATYFSLDVHAHFVVVPSLIGLGTALLLFASPGVSSGASASRWPDPLAFIGRYSYEIYLLHIVVFCLVRPVVSMTLLAWPVSLFAFVLGLTVLVSALAGRFYSEPMNKAIRGIRDGHSEPERAVPQPLHR